MRSLLKKVFGSPQDKNVTRLYPVIDEINELEPQMLEASDDEFKQFRLVYTSRYKAGENLDDLLPEVFAWVREAARAAWPAALRRPADGRHRPAPGQDRRDADR